MEPLDNLLSKIKKSLLGDLLVREEVSRLINNALGIDIIPKDISIQGTTLRIKTSPAKRNEIKLNQERILTEIKLKTKLNLKEILY